jgi:hypothetical protein
MVFFCAAAACSLLPMKGSFVRPMMAQGGPLSPLLSNIALDELDWELERRGLQLL